MGTLTQAEPPRPGAERILDAVARGVGAVWPAGGRALGRLVEPTGDLLRKATEDDVATQASALTFTAFVALFPALLLATSIAGFWLRGRGEETLRQLVDAIPGLEPLLTQSAHTIVQGRYASGVVGLLGLLWAASALSNRARRSLAVIFAQHESIVRGRLWAVVATIALGLGVLVGVTLAGPSRGSSTGARARRSRGSPPRAPFSIVLVGAFLLIYRLLLPRAIPYRQLLPGAIVCAVGWTVLQGVGGWFVARSIDRWSALYGTIASVFGVLLFLRIMAWVFLAGAELSSIRATRAAQEG
jgi:YihY family inner membrane protein